SNAFQRAMGGKPGPVYLDLPRDVLQTKVSEETVDWGISGQPLLRPRTTADGSQVNALGDALRKATRPVGVSGRGVVRGQAWGELGGWIEERGVPFYTPPQGRGVLPDDHPQTYPAMRSAAFRDADFILIVGTRMNFIINHGAPPRFSAGATIARIDIDPDE